MSARPIEHGMDWRALTIGDHGDEESVLDSDRVKENGSVGEDELDSVDHRDSPPDSLASAALASSWTWISRSG
jgi:hypothetical protein